MKGGTNFFVRLCSTEKKNTGNIKLNMFFNENSIYKILCLLNCYAMFSNGKICKLLECILLNKYRSMLLCEFIVLS